MSHQFRAGSPDDGDTEITVYPKPDGCRVYSAWRDEYGLRQEVQVSIGDTSIKVERRQTLEGESGFLWDTVHESPTRDLLAFAPKPEPAGFRIGSALMLTFEVRANPDAFTPQ